MTRLAAIRRRKAFSIVGFTLVALYLLLSIALLIEAFRHAGDPKGSFVMAQLPVVFVHGALWKLGWLRLIESLPGILAYVALLLLTLIVVYAVGWLIGTGGSWFWSLINSNIHRTQRGNESHG